MGINFGKEELIINGKAATIETSIKKAVQAYNGFAFYVRRILGNREFENIRKAMN